MNSVGFALLIIAFVRCEEILGPAVFRLRQLQTSENQANLQANVHQIPIEDYEDNMYLVKVSVGKPPQNFTVQLDTSSADFWLTDSTCESIQCKGRVKPKTRYNASASRTYQEDGTEFLVEYVYKGVQGPIGRDRMSIGDIEIERQSFGRGLLLDLSFGVMPLDGILGFGRPELSQTGIKTPLQNILEQLDDEDAFSIFLNSKKSKEKIGGMLTLGGLDSKNCDSDWTYTNLTHSHYWGFAVTKATFGDSQLATNFEAIADTRDSLILVPDPAFQQIITTLKATRIQHFDFYEIPCDRISEAPDLAFEMEGKSFVLTGHDYIGAKRIGGRNKCVVLMGDATKKGFQDGQWLLSDPFLRKFCSAYFYKEKKIAFAKAVHGQ